MFIYKARIKFILLLRSITIRDVYSSLVRRLLINKILKSFQFSINYMDTIRSTYCIIRRIQKIVLKKCATIVHMYIIVNVRIK